MKRSFSYSSFPIYAIGDEVAVDKLGNYAELRKFIKEIEGELGLDLLNSFPAAKKLGSVSDDGLEFDQEMREVVYTKMSREFALFSDWN